MGTNSSNGTETDSLKLLEGSPSREYSVKTQRNPGWGLQKETKIWILIRVQGRPGFPIPCFTMGTPSRDMRFS